MMSREIACLTFFFFFGFLQSIEKELRGQVDDAIAKAKVRRLSNLNFDCCVAL